MSLIFVLVVGAVLLSAIVLVKGRSTKIVLAGSLAILTLSGLSRLGLRVINTYRYAGTRSTMLEMAQSLEAYHKSHGSFPDGMTLDSAGPRMPMRDRWGHVFRLQTTAHSFVLTSYGADGKPGGTEFDQDLIVSWKEGDKALTVDAADYSP